VLHLGRPLAGVYLAGHGWSPLVGVMPEARRVTGAAGFRVGHGQVQVSRMAASFPSGGWRVFRLGRLHRLLRSSQSSDARKGPVKWRRESFLPGVTRCFSGFAPFAKRLSEKDLGARSWAKKFRFGRSLRAPSTELGLGAQKTCTLQGFRGLGAAPATFESSAGDPGGGTPPE
jgi:hypothetical protein